MRKGLLISAALIGLLLPGVCFALASILGQLRVAESWRQAGGLFNDGVLDSNYFASAVSANATATVSGGQAILTTTTDSGSSAEILSQRFARYVGANSNYYRATVRVGDMGAVNNLRRWGALNKTTPVDGYFFQLNDTTFQIGHTNSGTVTTVNNGAFNGAKPSYDFDTNFHVYEINYTARKVLFSIDGVLVHTLTATTTPLVSTMHLKPYAANINTGVGSAVTLFLLNMTINRLGTATTQPRTHIQNGSTAGVLLKVGPGQLHKICPGSVANNSTAVIYDATIATGTAYTLTFAAAYSPTCVEVDTGFDQGLYLVQNGVGSSILYGYE